MRLIIICIFYCDKYTEINVSIFTLKLPFKLCSLKYLNEIPLIFKQSVINVKLLFKNLGLEKENVDLMSFVLYRYHLIHLFSCTLI